eukprot:gene13162-13292_t
MDLEHMFNRAPVPIYQVGGGRRRVEQWNRVLVCGAAGVSGLTKESFLTRWRALALEDPRMAFEQARGAWWCCSVMNLLLLYVWSNAACSAVRLEGLVVLD